MLYNHHLTKNKRVNGISKTFILIFDSGVTWNASATNAPQLAA